MSAPLTLQAIAATCKSKIAAWQSPGEMLILAVALIMVMLLACLLVRKFLLAVEVQETGIGFEWSRLPETLSPLLCGLIVFCVFEGILTASGFSNPDTRGEAFGFMGTSAPDGKDVAAEQGARGLWAVTAAVLILAEIAVAWTVVGLWLHCPVAWRARVAQSTAAVAAVVAVAIFLGGSREFGSKLVGDLVCITSHRTGFFNLGPITDMLNGLGIVVPLLVAVGFCLVLIPQSEDMQFDANLQRHARRQRALDQILYVGAAVLVAGLMEVVALVSWSYAPFQGTADLKLHADICKGPGPPASSAAAVQATSDLASSDFCKDSPSLADRAPSVDNVRKFTQSLALIYGASFSALLVSFYLPAALVLQRRLRALLESQDSMLQPDVLAAKLSRFDVDRTPVKQGITLAVSLGPMVAGIAASLIKLQ